MTLCNVKGATQRAEITKNYQKPSETLLGFF